jgi:hypothetical protein
MGNENTIRNNKDPSVRFDYDGTGDQTTTGGPARSEEKPYLGGASAKQACEFFLRLRQVRCTIETV